MRTLPGRTAAEDGDGVAIDLLEREIVAKMVGLRPFAVLAEEIVDSGKHFANTWGQGFGVASFIEVPGVLKEGRPGAWLRLVFDRG